MTDDWSDSMTVLRAHRRRLTKLHASDGSCQDYDAAYHFDAASVRVAGIPDLMGVLRRLLTLPDRCVVRGEIIGGERATRIRRLAYPDAETGDQPTLRDAPRRWLALDADGITLPENVPIHDLEACADVVLATLPAVFARTAMIVQASASHGIKPGCRLRLWFWCDRPVTGRELVRWLAGTPLDPSVFRTVQPIYTAAPVFGPGRIEHLPRRLLELPGIEWLACPTVEELADPPPKPRPAPQHITTGFQADAYGRAALIRAADAIVHAGEGKRHGTIIAESRGLARLVEAGLLLERDLIAVVTRAAERAGKSDPEEIASCIAWGIANPSTATLPEARSAA